MIIQVYNDKIKNSNDFLKSQVDETKTDHSEG
jgi:hypothetical protein